LHARLRWTGCTLDFAMHFYFHAKLCKLYLYIDTDTTVIESSAVSMDRDQIRFYWTKSTAVDRKPRCRPAPTTVGVNMTAITLRMCQSNVQPVRVLVQIIKLDFSVKERTILQRGRTTRDDRKHKQLISTNYENKTGFSFS